MKAQGEAVGLTILSCIDAIDTLGEALGAGRLEDALAAFAH
jgi:hypothetical protein